MKSRLCAALVTLVSLAPFVLADQWLPPTPQAYRAGDCEFRTDPARGFHDPGVGTLARVGAQVRTVLWKRDLVNLPYKVRIVEDGQYVLTIDTYGNLGYDHALVVYGDKGKVLADLKLADFLTEEEIAKHVKQTEGSRWWYSDKHTFAFANNQLAVELDWGKTFAVSLRTGKVIAAGK